MGSQRVKDWATFTQLKVCWILKKWNRWASCLTWSPYFPSPWALWTTNKHWQSRFVMWPQKSPWEAEKLTCNLGQVFWAGFLPWPDQMDLAPRRWHCTVSDSPSSQTLLWGPGSHQAWPWHLVPQQPKFLSLWKQLRSKAFVSVTGSLLIQDKQSLMDPLIWFVSSVQESIFLRGLKGCLYVPQ